VTANVELKSSIPFGPKVEIKGFVLRVKAAIAKSFQFSSSYKEMLNFMALYWPPRLRKKDTITFGKPILQPLRPMFQHLLIS
jgi:hypothetical protein